MIKKMDSQFSRIVVKGVIAFSTTQYIKTDLLLQRSVDQFGNDSILVATDSGIPGTTSYIVPTETIKMLLEKPVEREEVSDGEPKQ